MFLVVLVWKALNILSISSCSFSVHVAIFPLYRALAYVTNLVLPSLVSTLAAVAPTSAQCALTIYVQVHALVVFLMEQVCI